MSTAIEWLHMGGYANYVWPAYLLVLGVFAAHFFKLKVRKKKIKRVLKTLVERD